MGRMLILPLLASLTFLVTLITVLPILLFYWQVVDRIQSQMLAIYINQFQLVAGLERIPLSKKIRFHVLLLPIAPFLSLLALLGVVAMAYMMMLEEQTSEIVGWYRNVLQHVVGGLLGQSIQQQEGTEKEQV